MLPPVLPPVSCCPVQLPGSRITAIPRPVLTALLIPRWLSRRPMDRADYLINDDKGSSTNEPPPPPPPPPPPLLIPPPAQPAGQPFVPVAGAFGTLPALEQGARLSNPNARVWAAIHGRRPSDTELTEPARKRKRNKKQHLQSSLQPSRQLQASLQPMQQSQPNLQPSPTPSSRAAGPSQAPFYAPEAKLTSTQISVGRKVRVWWSKLDAGKLERFEYGVIEMLGGQMLPSRNRRKNADLNISFKVAYPAQSGELESSFWHDLEEKHVEAVEPEAWDLYFSKQGDQTAALKTSTLAAAAAPTALNLAADKNYRRIKEKKEEFEEDVVEEEGGVEDIEEEEEEEEEAEEEEEEKEEVVEEKRKEKMAKPNPKSRTTLVVDSDDAAKWPSDDEAERLMRSAQNLMLELSKTLTLVVNTIEKSNATKEESPSKKRAMAAQQVEQCSQSQAQKAKKLDTSSKLSEKLSQKKEATVRKQTSMVDQELLKSALAKVAFFGGLRDASMFDDEEYLSLEEMVQLAIKEGVYVARKSTKSAILKSLESVMER